MSRARRNDNDAGILWMEADNESTVWKAGIKARHSFQAFAAQTRQSVLHEFSVHLIDFPGFHFSIHDTGISLNRTLFGSDLHTSPQTVDCRKPIKEVRVMLTKLPEESRELARKVGLDSVLQLEPEEGLALDFKQRSEFRKE